MAEVAPATKKPAQVDDKIHTWPHLVRGEFLVTIFVLVVLTLWAILLDAPLEEPANPTRTPNPSKAPWYFLGLQEMLVYYDPWHAGVVLPTLIIIGLMVIPFIDINPAGNGYYCFKDRKYEILTFFFGFHILWVSMIIIGTFFRGPGWNLFWPWEHWDPHKVAALTNVDLPYLVGFRNQTLSVLFGLFCVVAYFVVGMALFYYWVVRIKGKEFMERWGPVRFGITAFLIVTMLALPVKMFLRLAFNVKYIVATKYINIQPAMFYVAKVFQALGVADVGYALYMGILQHSSMAEEIVLTLIGVGVFSLGRTLEKRLV